MSLRPYTLRAAGCMIAVAGALALAPAANAQSGPPTGRLSCNVGPGLGLIITSQRPMECRFTPRRGPVQRYLGVVRNFGLDVGKFGRSTMSWRVYGPYARAPKGALNGRYAGVTAGASAGVGGSGNVLVGGRDNKVTLQPVSLQGARGINVAIGVTGFELKQRGGR
jgi:hypothetical protein